MVVSQIFRTFVPTEQTAALWGGQMTAAQAEKRNAPNLRNENLGNFQQARLNKAIGQYGFHALCVGLCSNFFIQVFLGPSFRNWLKQSRASAVWIRENLKY